MTLMLLLVCLLPFGFECHESPLLWHENGGCVPTGDMEKSFLGLFPSSYQGRIWVHSCSHSFYNFKLWVCWLHVSVFSGICCQFYLEDLITDDWSWQQFQCSALNILILQTCSVWEWLYSGAQQGCNFVIAYSPEDKNRTSFKNMVLFLINFGSHHCQKRLNIVSFQFLYNCAITGAYLSDDSVWQYFHISEWAGVVEAEGRVVEAITHVLNKVGNSVTNLLETIKVAEDNEACQLRLDPSSLNICTASINSMADDLKVIFLLILC